MKKVVVATIAFLAFAGCAKKEATPSWEEFAASTVAEYYEFNPEVAVSAGLHEYDGQMTDKSAAGHAAKAE